MEKQTTTTEAYATNFKHLSELKEWVGKEFIAQAYVGT